MWLRWRTGTKAAGVEEVSQLAPVLGGQAGSDATRQFIQPIEQDARRVVLGSLALYMASRAVSFLAILTSTWLAPTLHVAQAYTAWDGGWYIRIAQHGYPSTVASEGGGNRWSFFPGFPLVIRLLHQVTTLSYTHSAMLAAWVFGGTAAVAIGLFVRDVFGEETALKTVAIIMFFPAAYVLNLAYAEGLLFTAIAACLLYVRRGRWLPAILLANVASLSKESGVAVIVAIAAEALLRRGRTPMERLRILAAAAASAVTFVGFCVYGWVRTGHPLAFASAEKAWDAKFVWFATPFRVVWQLLSTRAAWHEADHVVAACGVVVVVAGLLYLIRLHREGGGVSLAWWGYAATGVLIVAVPFWPTGILRYTMIPLIVFAPAFAHLARPRLFEGAVGAFGVLQGAIAIVIFVGLVNGHAVLAP